MTTSSDILDVALSIIEMEIAKLKFISDNAVGGNNSLDKQQASVLTDYVKTLIIARKDEREAAKLEELQAATDAELADMVRQATDYLETDNETTVPDEPTEPPE